MHILQLQCFMLNSHPVGSVPAMGGVALSLQRRANPHQLEVLFLGHSMLPVKAVMNQWWYEWLAGHHFACWRDQVFGTGVKAALLQDHERALWKERPLTAMKKEQINLLDHFPKCSQDLTPIEAVWRELRARLADTEPTHKESRDEFIVRMRNAVSWINRNRKE